MNVPIILGYDEAFPKPVEVAVQQVEESWFAEKFVMLGGLFVAVVAVALIVVPVFV